MALNYQRRYTEGTKFRPPKLTFRAEDYNPQGLQQYDERALRKEYTRLRDIAQKRLKRLGESRFSEAEAYQQNVGQFEQLRNIRTVSQLRQSLTQLARFVLAESSTIQGQKAIMQRGIQTWHEKGYKWVNESNWFAFVRFLEYVKSNDKNIYSLDAAADAFQAAEEAGNIDNVELLFEEYQNAVDGYR